MGKFFGNNSGSFEQEWMQCPGCSGSGNTTTQVTDENGNSVDVTSDCGGCSGTGQVPGQSRS